jgi:hypothetical protein
MMNRILGLPAGAWANAGRLVAGRLIVAKATLETNNFVIRPLIFMIQILPGEVWSAIEKLRIACTDRRKQSSSPPALASVGRLPYQSIDFPQVALRALCDFGRNILIKPF